jgi:hypothetical protein
MFSVSEAFYGLFFCSLHAKIIRGRNGHLKRPQRRSNISRKKRAFRLLRLDVELTRECCVLVFLIGQEIAKLRAAEKIDEHSLTLKSISDALCLHRIGNVLR